MLIALTAAGATALRRLDKDSVNQDRRGEPYAASSGELRDLAARIDRPVYWAGERPGTRLELTRTDTDRVYVRYLPPGVGVADKRPGFLTIASYPYPGAFKAVSASLKRPGTVGLPALNSGLVAWNTKRPTSVYFAARNSNVLVEVFSPRRNEARRLVLGGDVTPVR